MPRPIPAIRAVLFDLDDTLIDTAPDVHDAVNRLLTLMDRPSLGLEEVTAIQGEGAERLVRRAVAATGAPPTDAALPALVDRFRRLSTGRAADRARAYPAAAAALAAARARGARTLVFSDRPYKQALDLLSRFGLGRDADLVIGSEGRAGAALGPGALRKGVSRLGVPVASTVLVCGRAALVRAGRVAGASTVAVRFGFTPKRMKETGAHHEIDTLDALTDMLERLEQEGLPGTFELLVKDVQRLTGLDPNQAHAAVRRWTASLDATGLGRARRLVRRMVRARI